MLEPHDGLRRREIFELLTARGHEWSHKVGVAGRADGSGKSSTRLLAVSGWVLKTDVARGAASRAAAASSLELERRRGLEARAWHPRKQWAVFRAGDTFYPLTLCPEMVTLRGLAQLNQCMTGWLEMLGLALQVARVSGAGLDLNPANFGRVAGDPRLYYLDDELYSELSIQHFAGAIAARIPEEPTLTPEQWQAWGAQLRALLQRSQLLGATSIADALLDYPLTEQFSSRRTALADALRSQHAGTTPKARRPDLVCVLADVHANLPALEAVLKAARSAGATRYLFLGDAVGYGPHPGQCVARLAELPNACFVKGNHDHCIGTGSLDRGMNGLARACAEWTLAELRPAELAWLRALPLEHTEADWLAVHGAPRDPKRLFAYVYELTFEDNLRWLIDHQQRLCFHGHSHVQCSYAELPSGPRRIAAGSPVELGSAAAFLINPGSVGQPRDHDPRAAFGLFDANAGLFTPVRVAYPLERTIEDMIRSDLPPEAARRLQTGA